MSKVKNLLGNTYGRLTVILFAGIINRSARWECKCICGETLIVQSNNLHSGHTQSCGCLNLELIKIRSTTHGESHKTKEYNSWKHMISRCECVTNPKYPDYGGRGITVCERWRKYELFLEDMGRAPSNNHTIHRVDNDGDYLKSNCIWATPITQANTKRSSVYLLYKNQKKTLRQWCESLGIDKIKTLKGRIDRGWSLDRTFNTPIG